MIKFPKHQPCIERFSHFWPKLTDPNLETKSLQNLGTKNWPFLTQNRLHLVKRAIFASKNEGPKNGPFWPKNHSFYQRKSILRFFGQTENPWFPIQQNDPILPPKLASPQIPASKKIPTSSEQRPKRGSFLSLRTSRAGIFKKMPDLLIRKIQFSKLLKIKIFFDPPK